MMRPLQRLLVLAPWLWCACIAQAHDLITSESAERYLTQAQERLDVLHSRQPQAQRAESAFALGRMLDEIRDLLNRDVAAHGRIQGLSTEYLVRELKRKGLPLELAPALGRFPANVSWYREALRIAPEGGHTNDAVFGILQGEFYDSFDVDPMRPRSQPWAALQEQIALGEQLIKRAPAYPEVEEAKFILAVLYTRAARTAPDRKTGVQYADRARASIADFQSRYAESMRAAALPVLLQSLEEARR